VNRRSFLTALMGGAAATAIGVVVASEAAKADSGLAVASAAVDATDAEFTQYRRGHRRPPRQVCTVVRDRFGRRKRVCRWVH
jgi:uncharacterized caspase-like protein